MLPRSGFVQPALCATGRAARVRAGFGRAALVVVVGEPDVRDPAQARLGEGARRTDGEAARAVGQPRCRRGLLSPDERIPCGHGAIDGGHQRRARGAVARLDRDAVRERCVKLRHGGGIGAR